MKTFSLALMTAAAYAWKPSIQLVGGFIYGVTKYDGLETLQTCMTDVDIWTMEIYHGIGMITEKDERGAIAGYRLIMSAID